VYFQIWTFRCYTSHRSFLKNDFIKHYNFITILPRVFH